MITNLKVAINRLDAEKTSDIPLPKAMSEDASGMDIYAAVENDIVILPGDTLAIPTGFAIAVPRGYEAQVRPRSGLALKHGIVIPNSPGTIDSDYRGEVKIIIGNISKKPFTVSRGDRIAQMVICPVVSINWDECENLPETERGPGGFGHTGV